MTIREKCVVVDTTRSSELKSTELAITDAALGDNDVPRSGKQSSSLQACYSLMKANLGAGIFSFPVAYVKSGFFTTIILLILTTIFIYWTSLILIDLGSYYGGSVTYETIVEHHLGKWGRRVCSISGIVLTFGALCVYSVVIADSLPPVFLNLFTPWTEKCILENTCDYNPVPVFLIDRKIISILVSLIIIIPLSSIRNSTYLSYVSVTGLACLMAIVVIMAVKSSLPSTPKGPLEGAELLTGVKWGGIAFVISTTAYANIINQNQFPIFESLADKSRANKLKIIRSCLITCVVIILVYSIATYVPLNDMIDGNVLNLFPQNDAVVNAARILFAVDIILTAPVVVYICRSFLLNAFCGGTQRASKVALLLTTFLLVAGSVTIASLFCKFDIVVALTGGLSASILAFGLPQVCWVSHALKSGRSWKDYKVILVSVSTIVCVLLVILSIMDLVDNIKAYKSENCPYSFI